MDQPDVTKLKALTTTTGVPGSVSKPQHALPTPPQTSTSIPAQRQPTTTGAVKHTQAILEYLGHRIVIRRGQNGRGIVDDVSKVPFVRGATLKFSIAPSETSSDPKSKESEKGERKIKGWTFSWEEEIRVPLAPSSKVPASDGTAPQWRGEWRPPYIKFVPGDTWGLVGFHRGISEEEVRYVRERVKSWVLGN